MEKEGRRRKPAGSSSSEGPHQRAIRQMAPCLFLHHTATQ